MKITVLKEKFKLHTFIASFKILVFSCCDIEPKL
jgi:hypothetical protein